MNTLDILKTTKYNNSYIDVYLSDMLVNNFISDGESYYYIYEKTDNNRTGVLKAIRIKTTSNNIGTSGREEIYLSGQYTLRVSEILRYKLKIIVPDEVMEVKRKAMEELK